MEPPLTPGTPTAIALSAIVAGLERVEAETRRLEAERVRLLGEAMELAGIESEQARSPHARLPELHAPEGARGELAFRAIRAEIATALHLSERAVDRRLTQAHTLVRDYPAVHAAMTVGEVSARHAAVIIDAGAVISAGEDLPGSDAPSDVNTECTVSEAEVRERRHAYTEAALAVTTGRTPAGLAVQAKRLAERYATIPLDARHECARRHRRVWVVDREDGMADLTAFLPAVQAYAIRDRLTRMARAVTDTERAAQATPRRSRDEARADVLTDLLLGGDPDTGGSIGGLTALEPGAASAGASAQAGPEPAGSGLAGVRAVVQVIIPAHALTEPADEPSPGTPNTTNRAHLFDDHDDDGEPRPNPETPELVGYGPIDTETARHLAGTTPGWDLIREHPTTGTILSVDRYRPTEQIRRLLRARDQHCRFPGCRVPAHRCDIDHTTDWATGGGTSTTNLAHLCRGHHMIKHHTGWQVKQELGGVLRWTSPSGRVHLDRPDRLPSRVRFSAETTERKTVERETAEASGSRPPPSTPF